MQILKDDTNNKDRKSVLSNEWIGGKKVKALTGLWGAHEWPTDSFESAMEKE
jgi:hypothetical protein